MDRTRLRSLLGKINVLASRLRNEKCPSIAEEITALVNNIDASVLELIYPTKLQYRLMRSPVVYADVCLTENLHCNLFGFRKIFDSIPLHDHPRMSGFLKVLRGRAKVMSFTKLVGSSNSCDGDGISARFDGEQIVHADDKCVHLNQAAGNIHEIVALDEGTFFIDVLTPGYGSDPCFYYALPEDLVEGDDYSLRRITKPPSFWCDFFHYLPVQL